MGLPEVIATISDFIPAQVLERLILGLLLHEAIIDFT